MSKSERPQRFYIDTPPSVKGRDWVRERFMAGDKPTFSDLYVGKWEEDSEELSPCGCTDCKRENLKKLWD